MTEKVNVSRDEVIETLENAIQLIKQQSGAIDSLRETVKQYAAAARTIALYTSAFCNRSLPYDEMIRDSVIKMATEYERVLTVNKQLQSERS